MDFDTSRRPRHGSPTEAATVGVGVGGARAVPRRHLDRRLRRSRSRRSSRERGWIGMTVAGRRRRRTAAAPLERVRRVRAAHRRRRADRGDVVRATGRSVRRCCSSASTGAAPALAARDPRRHRRCGASACREPDNGSRRRGPAHACASRDGDDWIVDRPEGVDLGRRRRRLDLPDRPHRSRCADRTPGCPSSSSTCDRPGIEIRRDRRHDRQRPLLRGACFDEVRVPAREPRRRAATAASARSMRQMEHERGGIDRLVSNRLLFEVACGAARGSTRRDPLVRQEFGAARDRLPDRSAARAARRCSDRAPQALLRRHEGDLHRVRAGRRAAFCARVVGPSGDAVRLRGGGSRESCRAAACCYAPASHDHGRHHADPAQHRSANGCSGCRARTRA